MKNRKRSLFAWCVIGIFVFLISFNFCLAADPDPNVIDFPNPLGFETVQGVLGSLLNSLQGIIVIVAIIFIIIGAIFYMTSAGDEGRMKLAKGAITAAMIGLAIGIAAPSFLREISIIIGWSDAEKVKACDYDKSGSVDTPDEQTCYDALTKSPSAAQISLNALNFLLSIVGVLALIMLIVGGIMYLTAAGSEDQIDKGKKIVKYSIIGIVIALAAMVIVKQIAKFFV